MDMSGMDMGGRGMSRGMDMSSEGPFRPTNEQTAQGLWYGIAVSVGLLCLVRLIRHLEQLQRRKACQNASRSIISRPQGCISKTWATATTTFRELSYPQPIYFTGRISRYFSPLPVGRWLILVVYWIVLLCFLWTGTILAPSNPMYAYKWEKVGFRAAWVSVSQIPFIYLLSCKFNPISILTGISYERFNWLHRWAARTVFLTIIVHWSFFFKEWALADFVTLELQMMPMVKYGFGAWATIGWMVLSGFGFFRHMCYELFVAQHVCAAATLLWLLYTHIPAYAHYNIYLAIGFISFDWGARIIWALLRNTHLLNRRAGKPLGYVVHVEPLPGDMVRLIIDDADFDWKAGQHAYISIPRLRPFELHPFTIANFVQKSPVDRRSRLTMVIKSHTGFSKSLHEAAVRNESTNDEYRAYLSGPWGHPPVLNHHDTVVLIACSSGASFTTPLLQDLVRNSGCVRSVKLHWIIRSEDHLVWYGDDLIALVDAAKKTLKLHLVIHVTRSMPPVGHQESSLLFRQDSQTEEASFVSSIGEEKTPLASTETRPISSMTRLYGGRPTIESMIRPPVEDAYGETAVVVCGGISITAQARTFVSSLSDERAVHKGSGAQGIYLFTETYGW